MRAFDAGVITTGLCSFALTVSEAVLPTGLINDGVPTWTALALMLASGLLGAAVAYSRT